ncbi:4'-phosphopantetheinyl transferase family protein [Paenibacillus sp. FSL M7-1046]|uniref:4'-phosphopantetheinyl transferase family protein n=1 Tax=Paenibacillus sp. FSL M7-1046 TaxID=2975315 RepID=UPI0030F4FFB7
MLPTENPSCKALEQGGALQFNLSHSQDIIVAAFCPSHQLGVDVEQIRPIADYEQLTSHFSHPLEMAALQRLPPLLITFFFNLKFPDVSYKKVKKQLIRRQVAF